jgi:hypothetical protein
MTADNNGRNSSDVEIDISDLYKIVETETWINNTDVYLF